MSTYPISTTVGSDHDRSHPVAGHASFRIQGPLSSTSIPGMWLATPFMLTRFSLPATSTITARREISTSCAARTPSSWPARWRPSRSAIAKVLRPWQSLNIGLARVTAVPAYTFTHHHPVSKGAGFCGFRWIITTSTMPGAPTSFPAGASQADVAILPVAAGRGPCRSSRQYRWSSGCAHRGSSGHWGTFGGTHLDVQAGARD